MSRIAGVVFDVNETLFSLDPVARRLERAGLSASVLEVWFARVLRDGFAHAAAGSFVPFPDVAADHLRRLARHQGVDRVDRVVGEVLDAFDEVVAHGDVAPAFDRARTAGVPIATLTNGTRSVTERFLDREGLAGHVTAVLDVSQAGVWKPAPAPYRLAADRLGAPPGEVAMVAVHPWDVHGARRAGLVGGWTNRDGGPYPASFSAPDVRGETLTEVVTDLVG